jgi:hypothetical protein
MRYLTKEEREKATSILEAETDNELKQTENEEKKWLKAKRN